MTEHASHLSLGSFQRMYSPVYKVTGSPTTGTPITGTYNAVYRAQFLLTLSNSDVTGLTPKFIEDTMQRFVEHNADFTARLVAECQEASSSAFLARLAAFDDRVNTRVLREITALPERIETYMADARLTNVASQVVYSLQYTQKLEHDGDHVINNRVDLIVEQNSTNDTEIWTAPPKHMFARNEQALNMTFTFTV